MEIVGKGTKTRKQDSYGESLLADNECLVRLGGLIEGGVLDDPREQPEALEKHIGEELRLDDRIGVIVAGPLLERLVVLHAPDGAVIFGCFPKQTLGDHSFFQRHALDSCLDQSSAVVSPGRLESSVLARLTAPSIRLIALYHSQHFPRPRFPLAISDVAASVRSNFVGKVSLADMQFGLTIPAVLSDLDERRPDIVGISVTFGQHDLFCQLMDGLAELPEYSPLVVAGGSLSALNGQYLLDLYPSLVIATGAGGETMSGLAEYWHGDRELTTIPSLLFLHANELTRSAVPPMPQPAELPELDLLESTLAHRGAMQLESSRGCTFSCSFCPREHKGKWQGDVSVYFRQFLSALDSIWKSYPDVSRKLYLVDEEFVGYSAGDQNLERASAIAELLESFGFSFESSTRVDQVCRLTKDRAWHARRIEFWRHLVAHGLRRMLFGVESGVDSILERFNKRTSGRENALAIRVLSSCGVPMRLTYITFDPLMTMDELRASYEFQGRTDLLLREAAGLSAENLATATRNEDYAKEAATGRPLYREITYMLVSMECLLGSPYLSSVEQSGLAREVSLPMGRRRAVYKDPRIGQMSAAGQLWIDRNFSLDYFLKSVEKVAGQHTAEAVREARSAYKDFSYELLGELLKHFEETSPDSVPDCAVSAAAAELVPEVASLLSAHFARFESSFVDIIDELSPRLPDADLRALEHVVDQWRSGDWHLINK